MREIKFRVWDNKKKKMLHQKSGDFVMTIRKGISISFLVGDKYARVMSRKPICYKLMQYTGLNDKKGKEIYEGDILRFPPTDDWGKINYTSFEVFHHDGDCANQHIGFQMNRNHHHGCVCGGTIPNFLPKSTKQMIIIGNIHENPELLPEDK